ncbi:MAG: ATP-binding protein [Candidatus Melainabacteria bacterium]|nr:ATP-binding protein [Candidatus Melainabacteria bacterium]
MSLENLRQELCSIVSHDIRAPMTSIGGLVTLLEVGALGDLDKEHESLVNRLSNSSADLLNVLNNILDLDKLRSNKWPLSIFPIPNEVLCERIQKELESTEYQNVAIYAEPGKLNCDVDAVARALLAIVQVFAEKTSAIKIECTESGGCVMTLPGDALALDIRAKSALSLAQLFCEKQSAKLSRHSLGSKTSFSIVPVDSLDTRSSGLNVIEQVQQSRPHEDRRPNSKIGTSLLFLLGRPLAVSVTAIVILSVVLNDIGQQLGKQLVYREMVHRTTSLASDMTHLMLLSIRRTSTEIEDEDNARKKVADKIDSDMQALKGLEAKTHISMTDELQLVQRKVDSIKSLSKEMTSKPLDELGSTLKKLVAGGELTSVAFSEAGSLITGQVQLDSIDTLLMSKLRSNVLLVLVGASILAALLTILGAVQVSRGFIARLYNVAENARRLTRREALRAPLQGNDEIAKLDTFFFDSAGTISRLEVERKELSSLLREQLKAPLLFLREGFSTIFSEATELSDKGKVLIQRTVVEIRRLSDLADDLLILDTLEESGCIRLETDITVTSVDDIVSRSIDAVTPQADLKEIDIVYGGEPSSMVKADASRSIQIMVNLLSNAVKFSPEKETITVTIEPLDGSVRFIVTDRGRGIPQSEFHRIFARFDQISKEDNRKGSGLGLFISKKLAEAQNGTLDFDSKEGEGSKFCLVLPGAGAGQA